MFVVIISLLTASYADKIILGLAKKGYRVGPMNLSDGQISLVRTNPDLASQLLSLHVEITNGSSMSLANDINAIITSNKAKHYGFVVSGEGNVSFNDSNISLKEIKDNKLKRIEKATHLRLVKSEESDGPQN